MVSLAAEPPSLVSTDSEDESDDAAADALDNGGSSVPSLEYSEEDEDEDEEDNDLPEIRPFMAGDGSSDVNDLPDLIEDNSHNDAEVDPITDSLVGNGGGLDMLQAMLQGPSRPVGSQADANQDDSSSDLPELEAFAPGGDAANGLGHPYNDQLLPASLAAAVASAASGHHTPLELDQQAALDDLSNNIDDAAALARSITQVCACCQFVAEAAILTLATSCCKT